jgi:hypothetical protein
MVVGGYRKIEAKHTSDLCEYVIAVPFANFGCRLKINAEAQNPASQIPPLFNVDSVWVGW